MISTLRLSMDLSRLNKVLEINDLMLALRRPEDERLVVEDFVSTELGRQAMASRVRLGPVDLQALAKLPADTLGGAYARFMLDRGLSPDAIPNRADTTEFEFAVAHLYESHDLWHVLTGFDSDFVGETGLQAFYLAQVRSHLPFFVLPAVLFNTMFFAYDDKDARLTALSDGWRLGKRARRLTGLDWRSRFNDRLVDVRLEFGIIPDEAQSPSEAFRGAHQTATA